MRLAAAPISWGVCEVPRWGYQLDRGRVLDDAARLGLREVEAGPPGFLPADAREARALLDKHDVRVIGGFVTAILHQADRLEAQLRALERQAAWLSDLGSEVLVLAALPRAVEVARRRGLDTALHPHVGTVIETAASIARVLSESDIPLCLDTGHIFVGGGDPARIAREYPRRIRHVHLKDADRALASAVRERRIGYAAAVAKGLFRPLGEGDAGIADVLVALKASNYSRWGVLEQDIALAGPPTEANDPAREVARSRDFARAHA